jgi:ATP-dependent helicase YprA (DUF1998 family)
LAPEVDWAPSDFTPYRHQTQAELQQVSAALYIGDTTEVGYPRVLTQRGEIRRARPDILITNYKMLNLLLQRADDLPLWEGTDLRYVVVDEFHTYDGAQGAVLLRRLAAATGSSEPGRPLGRICPVATSATLGEGGDGTRIQEVARAVFGTESAMKAEGVSSCDLRMSRSPSQVLPPGLFARVRRPMALRAIHHP